MKLGIKQAKTKGKHAPHEVVAVAVHGLGEGRKLQLHNHAQGHE